MSAPPPDPSSRLAVGSQPVNRRTRRLAPLAGDAQPQAVQQRQQQLRAMHELGVPLAAGARPAPPARPLPLSARVQAVVGVASLSGALFVGEPLAIGALALVGVVNLAWVARGVWRQRSPAVTVADDVGLSAEALAALNALLVRAAPALPEPATAALKLVKQQLALAQQPDAAARLAAQDRLFVQQCVARYLPDSLEAYLRLPAARRALPLAEGQPSADDALVGQLTSLHDGLQRRLAPLQDEAAEALLRQQRFLDAKARE